MKVPELYGCGDREKVSAHSPASRIGSGWSTVAYDISTVCAVVADSKASRRNYPRRKIFSKKPWTTNFACSLPATSEKRLTCCASEDMRLKSIRILACAAEKFDT